jgi:non-ribosomal peptide synthase protein (TIGR01720 family)
LLDISYGDDWSRQIKEIKETLRRVPNKGTGYGILKYLTKEEHKQGMENVFHLKPQITFNYLGQFDEDVGNLTTMAIANEQPGNIMNPDRQWESDFLIEGIILDKKLQVMIYFSKKQYRRKTVETLMETYKEKLTGIIDLCWKKEEAELTPSDMDYQDLSIEELENFFN